jgi:hypothetical protein
MSEGNKNVLRRLTYDSRDPAPRGILFRIPARRGDRGASRKSFSMQCVMAPSANSYTIPRQIQTMGWQGPSSDRGRRIHAPFMAAPTRRTS